MRGTIYVTMLVLMCLFPRLTNFSLYSVLINMDPVNKLYFFDWMILLSTHNMMGDYGMLVNAIIKIQKKNSTNNVYLKKIPLSIKAAPNSLIIIIIDNKLNWSAHITYIKNKISKSIGIFLKFLDKQPHLPLFNLLY